MEKGLDPKPYLPAALILEYDILDISGPAVPEHKLHIRIRKPETAVALRLEIIDGKRLPGSGLEQRHRRHFACAHINNADSTVERSRIHKFSYRSQFLYHIGRQRIVSYCSLPPTCE